MKTFSFCAIICFILLANTAFGQDPNFDYFSQEPPGDSAVIFAPGIISLPDRKEQSIVFSPDGSECFFGEWAGDFSYARLYHCKYEHGKWSQPTVLTSDDIDYASNPFLSEDGKTLYFHNAEYRGSYDIWMMKKISEEWESPREMPEPVNSKQRDGCYVETNQGVIYIASNRKGGNDKKGDIWRMALNSDNQYEVENLASVNSGEWDWAPCVSKDEYYLIFTSERPGGNAYDELYISFKNKEGKWTEPVNMELSNSGINLKGNGANSATLSPDGKYLFFSRSNDIYWVSTGVINKIRTKVLVE